MAKKQDVILKESGKYKNVYLLNTPVFWAKVNKAYMNDQSGKKEYSLIAFVNEECKEKLEDLGLNKEFAEVDKTKIKKGKNRGNIKYPSDKYEGMEGMYGITISKDAEYQDGGKFDLVVASEDGKSRFKGAVGNGSILNIQCSAYAPKTDPDALCINLHRIKIVDLVEYESSGGLEDDLLGIHIEDDETDMGSVDSDEPPFDTEDGTDDSDY